MVVLEEQDGRTQVDARVSAQMASHAQTPIGEALADGEGKEEGTGGRTRTAAEILAEKEMKVATSSFLCSSRSYSIPFTLILPSHPSHLPLSLSCAPFVPRSW